MTPETVRTFTVLLPLPPAALSPNGSHGHWATHARAARAYREVCWATVLAVWREAPRRPFPRARVSLRLVYCRTARSGSYCPTDADNAVAATKQCRDALVDAEVCRGDHITELELGPVTIERHRGHRPGQCRSGVLLTVEEVL